MRPTRAMPEPGRSSPGPASRVAKRCQTPSRCLTPLRPALRAELAELRGERAVVAVHLAVAVPARRDAEPAGPDAVRVGVDALEGELRAVLEAGHVRGQVRLLAVRGHERDLRARHR